MARHRQTKEIPSSSNFNKTFRLRQLYFACVNNLLSVMILSSNWFLFDWEKFVPNVL